MLADEAVGRVNSIRRRLGRVVEYLDGRGRLRAERRAGRVREDDVESPPLKVAARQESPEARQSEKVKAEVARRGTGKKARVTVGLRDRSLVKGYISSAGEDDFVVADPKTGRETKIAYGEVSRVSGRGMSKGAKIGLIVGIGAGVTALAFGLAIKDSLEDFGRQ